MVKPCPNHRPIRSNEGMYCLACGSLEPAATDCPPQAAGGAENGMGGVSGADVMTERVNKYNARKQTYDGITFDSLREVKRYKELRLRELAGEIRDLQVHYPLVCMVRGVKVCKYLADFWYIDQTTLHAVCEDVKSKPTITSTYRLKKRLVKACLGIDIVEIMK